MKLKSKFKILSSLIISLAISPGLFLQSQTCGGIIPGSGSNLQGRARAATCNNNTPEYISKYGKQSFYTPTANDPIIKINITLHVFMPSAAYASTSRWTNNPTPNYYFGAPRLLQFLADPTFNDPSNPTVNNPIVNGYSDRYSLARLANYPAPTALILPQITDSRIQYNLTNVYYYTNDYIYNGYDPHTVGVGPITSYISTNYPGRLDEGLPIVMVNGTSSAFTSDFGSPAAPIIVVGQNPWDVNSTRNTIRHEMGHALGLFHPQQFSNYNCCPENVQCDNNPDFLWDVFPNNDATYMNNYCAVGGAWANTYQGTSIACKTCLEADNGLSGTQNFAWSSNNILTEGIYAQREWMSPLQMARRIRSMHVFQPTGVSGIQSDARKYAADVESQHTNPWQITADETWQFDIQMYRDILVKSGHTLTIKCKVKMAIRGKIQVEPGARLIIDGGEVTNWCKTGLWGSIQVAGNINYPQGVYPNGYDPNHGFLQIINGGTVSNSGGAITNYLTDVNNNILWSTTGGLIYANGANFINNTRDVEFLSYPFAESSTFMNCKFLTNGPIGNSAPGVAAQPFAHVTMWMTKGTKFKGCDFENTAAAIYGSNRGGGILSMDAMYSIDQLVGTTTNTPSIFKGFTTGVNAINSNPLYVVSITNTQFIDNISAGVNFKNMNHFLLERNQFITPGGGWATAVCGLYLDGCRYYNVRNNSFTEEMTSNQTDVGIYVYNSQTGSHEIYKNTFARLLVGICAEGDNSGNSNIINGLKMNCNDFTVGTLNLYDIALLDVGTTRASVSTLQSNFNNTNLQLMVRNRYDAGDPCIPATCENRWFIQGTSIKGMFHYTFATANTQITPQPAYSDVAMIAPVISWATLTSANWSTVCPDNQIVPTSTPHNQIPIVLNTNITNLRASNVNNQNNQAIQATVAQKLNFFATDTLYHNTDSIIAILHNNQGGMDDADVLTAFGYMYKGDFTNANTMITALPAAKANWAAMLQKLVYMQQNPTQAYNIHTSTNLSFFQTYAQTAGMQGQFSAQGFLEFLDNENYYGPRLLPSNTTAQKSVGIPTINNDNEISAFPNPTNDLINVNYKLDGEAALNISLTDISGREVYKTQVFSGSSLSISMKDFAEGIYVLEAYTNGKQVYHTKIILTK